MYDIPQLEKKWRKYKRKKIQKPIIIASVIAVIGVGLGLLTTTYLNKTKDVVATTKVNSTQNVNNQISNNVQNSNTQKANEQAIVITRVENKNANPLVNVQPTKPQAQIGVNIDPQKEDAQSANIIDISKAEIVKPNVPDDEIRVIGFDSKEKKNIKKKYEDILVPSQSQENIKNREKIAEIEERFKSYQDPKDSLELSKIYYKNADYKKAESWAVSTNNIDGDIEESWLIFAKSRAKQGDRKDAIKVLQSYYDETNSAKAKALLVKIRFGKSF